MQLGISDIRCQNELDMVHSLEGVVIKVNRPNLHLLYENDTHESETEIQNLVGYDYEVLNDSSIENLHSKVDELFSTTQNL